MITASRGRSHRAGVEAGGAGCSTHRGQCQVAPGSTDAAHGLGQPGDDVAERGRHLVRGPAGQGRTGGHELLVPGGDGADQHRYRHDGRNLVGAGPGDRRRRSRARASAGHRQHPVVGGDLGGDERRRASHHGPAVPSARRGGSAPAADPRVHDGVVHRLHRLPGADGRGRRHTRQRRQQVAKPHHAGGIRGQPGAGPAVDLRPAGLPGAGHGRRRPGHGDRPHDFPCSWASTSCIERRA